MPLGGRPDITDRVLSLARELPLLVSLPLSSLLMGSSIEGVFDRLHNGSNKKITPEIGLQYALSLALFSVVQGGGPFGAVILKDG
ncbi:MAG: hypothetical protein ACO3K7_05390, partial [Candidatus Marinamargulisbacteria bacterium]